MTISLRRTMSSRPVPSIRLIIFAAGIVMPLAMATAANPPRHVADLQAGGLLGAMSVASSVVTVAAGQRFTALTQDSQNELCQIVLTYFKSDNASIASVRIVSAGGQVLTTCSA